MSLVRIIFLILYRVWISKSMPITILLWTWPPYPKLSIVWSSSLVARTAYLSMKEWLKLLIFFQGYFNFTTKLGYCYSTTWYSIHCQYDASNGDTIACRNSNSERRKFTEATFDMKLLDVHQTIKVVDIYERDSWETLVHMHISQVRFYKALPEISKNFSIKLRFL